MAAVVEPEDTENAGTPIDRHWGYEGAEGPEHWVGLGYVECGGAIQSPIDIPGDAFVHYDDIAFTYAPMQLEIINNGHTIKVVCNESSYITVSGMEFKLLQYHFHAPSEHTSNGNHYDMEMHLVHQSVDGEYVVIGVMIQKGSENSSYAVIWDHMPSDEGESIKIDGVSTTPADLLPLNHDYYAYDGSFTTPPCTEGVKWYVLTDPVELSSRQIEQFRAIYDSNNRPLQIANGRLLN